MNQRDVFHCDIKDSNILVKDDGSAHVKTRLIDWGLSYLQNDDKKDIPEALYILSTQWHHPFSSLLFNKNSILHEYVNIL